MNTIGSDYSQYMHTYEAFRIPKGHEVLNIPDADVAKMEDDQSELILTEKSSKQIVKDRFKYSSMLQTQSEQAALRTQEEAQKQQLEEKIKAMAVFNSMSKGNIVPAFDEKKLMEYDSKMYQLAKTSQMMAQNAERKKERSLWDEKEEAEKKARLDKLSAESNELAGSIGAKSSEFAEAQKSRVVETEVPEAYLNAIGGFRQLSGDMTGAVLDMSI